MNNGQYQVCPKCGTSVLAHSPFCFNCGHQSRPFNANAGLGTGQVTPVHVLARLARIALAVAMIGIGLYNGFAVLKGMADIDRVSPAYGRALPSDMRVYLWFLAALSTLAVLGGIRALLRKSDGFALCALASAGVLGAPIVWTFAQGLVNLAYPVVLLAFSLLAFFRMDEALAQSIAPELAASPLVRTTQVQKVSDPNALQNRLSGLMRDRRVWGGLAVGLLLTWLYLAQAGKGSYRTAKEYTLQRQIELGARLAGSGGRAQVSDGHAEWVLFDKPDGQRVAELILVHDDGSVRILPDGQRTPGYIGWQERNVIGQTGPD